ncbi:MAG: response regulator [Lachnospiraceae bacterium]|nr:response regulator [Lachnospiraceae bacterium]
MLNDEYEVSYADNGQAAYDMLTYGGDKYSLMFLDLIMPVLDGYNLLDMCRKDPTFDELPIIVMTQESAAEVISIKAGAADFISKPFDRPEVIKARCKRIIDLYEQKSIIARAESDVLTGLYSKQFFFQYLRRLERFNPDLPMDAIVINVEHFHLINEICGRDEGDAVLKKIADLLMQKLDDNYGIACRSDADTFFVYVNGLDDYQSLVDDIAKEAETENSLMKRTLIT